MRLVPALGGNLPRTARGGGTAVMFFTQAVAALVERGARAGYPSQLIGRKVR